MSFLSSILFFKNECNKDNKDTVTLKKELNKLLSQIENAKHEKKNLEMEINKYKIIINNENVMKLYEELFANICKDLYLSNDNIMKIFIYYF